jgi:RHS repeat-associated protein
VVNPSSSFNYAYSPTGKVVSETAIIDNKTTNLSYEYDAVGELISYTRNNIKTTYSYNHYGDRLEASGTALSAYVYNEDNQLTKKTSLNGSTTYAYNDDGHLISKTGTDRVIKTPTKMTDQGPAKDTSPATTTYEYSDDGKLATVREDGCLLMSALYDGDGKKLYEVNRTTSFEARTKPERTPENDNLDSPQELDANPNENEPDELNTNLTPLPDLSTNHPQITTSVSVHTREEYTKGQIEYRERVEDELKTIGGPLKGFITAPIVRYIVDLLIKPKKVYEYFTNTDIIDGMEALRLDIPTNSELIIPIWEGDTPMDKSNTSVFKDRVYDPKKDQSLNQVNYMQYSFTNSMEDIEQVLAVDDISNKTTTNYAYGSSRLGFEYDGHGSVVADSQHTYTYDPFGNILTIDGKNKQSTTHTDDGKPTPERPYPYASKPDPTDLELPFFGYNSEQQNPITDLIYMRYRYYSPDTANFISEDSYLGDDENILSQNRYTYAENDPINNNDPTGHIANSLIVQQVNANVNRYGTQPFMSYADWQIANQQGATNERSYEDYRISWSIANTYITKGADAAYALCASYNCTPGSQVDAAIQQMEKDVRTAQQDANEKIGGIRSGNISDWETEKARRAEEERRAVNNRKQWERGFNTGLHTSSIKAYGPYYVKKNNSNRYDYPTKPYGSLSSVTAHHTNIKNIYTVGKYRSAYKEYGYNVVKQGDYAIIKGAKSPFAIKEGVRGTRYATKNATKYTQVFKHINPRASARGSFMAKGTYFGMALDVGVELYEDVGKYNKGEITATRIGTNIVTNVAFSAGGVASSAAVGALVGSVVPGIGTVGGAIVGLIIGAIYLAATEQEFIYGKSVKQYAQEGVYYLVGQG